MTKSTWRSGLFMLLLILAGCFQQAGESLQSTDNTLVPVQQDSPTVAGSTSESTEPVDVASPTTRPLSSGPITATLPPITIIVPPTNTPRQAATETSASDASVSNQSDAAVTATSVQFITPGIPLGPDLETAAPTSPGGALTSTPSGLITPTALTGGAANASVEVNIDPECTYTVQRGDTVYRIALSNDTTVAAMKEANPDLEGDNPIIQPGQVLVLPDCGGTSTSEEISTEEVEATATRVPSIIQPAFPGMTPTVPPATGSTETYIVQPGDTLFIIAQRFGTTVAALVQANELSDPNRLSIGQELIIPQRP